MQLTLNLFRKLGWRPRSVGTPGRQWSGKNRRIRAVTSGMKKRMRDKENRIASVEEMIQFSYLTKEEAEIPKEKLEEIESIKNRMLWQKRILGHDVFGLGAGKPSPLDHFMVTDTRRYSKKDDE
ncbi:uncharacterized protein [Clytia hemisphaerica]|uniref:Uncharacterized protein n=1 Tax=Clytia hemisphaerica TaxID=252671 RepID=A0A7M5UGK6_9CNID